ncbi:ATP-binding protein [Streptomyces sp. V3I7]|uniref:ATP-binding protein n=1 Tax=Streptomyces sp. V3I7 TaxID=3042278 RepID=UPI0027D7D67B|nr:ATP-binding protein [Streptomyces sp. V3I7]
MDPINRGPEEYGQDGEGHAPRQRPPRDSLTQDFGHSAPARVRTARVVSGDFLLTVNPVDGSEIEACPPADRPARPVKLTAAERAEAAHADRPPTPAGPARPELPLLERQDERERLVRLLARGRSIRLTGAAGSGRTSLLDLVADDCFDLAPDGVVRLSGFDRTVGELFHDLFHAVYMAPGHRPEQDELLALVREIAAVVVVDDLAFGGAALDELLDATPECAFLFAATPDVPEPTADSGVELVALDGLKRAASVELLERAAGRALTEEESNWAGDLWFESEGLPLRFVQAGALLRQRDHRDAEARAVDEFGVFQDAQDVQGEAPAAPYDAEDGGHIPLPSLGEAAGPAPLLAARLSPSAREALRFAVALDGEMPHQAHLPALVGDTHADAALGELTACGLVSPVGARYRLAAGVADQLRAAGYGDDVEARARTAARHYTWWAGHASVTPERVCAEADAVLATLAVLVPLGPDEAAADEDGENGTPNATLSLARSAAPAFAAGLHWGAWERVLRFGVEAARPAGDVTEQAYFHHELGILALCGGQYERARAELEAAIGLRGALADKHGTVTGRRALALVADRTGDVSIAAAAAVTEELAAVRPGEQAPARSGSLAPFPTLRQSVTDTAVTQRASVPAASPAATPHSTAKQRGLRRVVRRNVVAGGAGALLVAVLGTVVTLGMSSHDSADDPSDHVNVNPSATQGFDDGGTGAGTPGKDGKGDTGTATSRPTDPGPDGTFGTADDPTPSASTARPSDEPSGTKKPSEPGTSSKPSSPKPSSKAPSSKSPTPTKTSPQPPSDTPPGTPSGTPSQSPTESSTPSTTDTASGPASSASASSSGSAPRGGSGLVI